MIARIVAAMQSPTLLNNLAQIRDVWSIEVVDLTDERDAFKESSLLELSRYDGTAGSVDMFWGCDEKHMRWANENLPGVPQAFFAHSGLPEYVGPSANGRLVVGMLLANLRMVATNFQPDSLHRLSPAYEAKPRWTWCPQKAWTMMSRPEARSAKTLASFQRVIVLAEEKYSPSPWWHLLYGQGQSRGFIGPEERERHLSRCSCYLSFQQPYGGFGLAEHEAMAAGTPVCAIRWGDMADEAPNHPGIRETEREVAAAAVRCLSDEGFAREVSEAGLEYIRKWRTRERLVLSARGLLSR